VALIYKTLSNLCLLTSVQICVRSRYESETNTLSIEPQKYIPRVHCKLLTFYNAGLQPAVHQVVLCVPRNIYKLRI
jgi:hypothetical protein